MPYTIHTAKATIIDAEKNPHRIDVFSGDLEDAHQQALDAIGRDNDQGARGAALTAITDAKTAAINQVNAAGNRINRINNDGATTIDETANMVAEDFDETKAYAAGTYVRKAITSGSGSSATTVVKLFRLTADYTAGASWESASKQEVKVGSQFTNLKSAFQRFTHPGDNVVTDLIFTQGAAYTDTGTYTVSDKWGYTDLIPIEAGKMYEINTVTDQYWCFYDENGDFISGFAGTFALAPSGSAYLRVSVVKVRQAIAKLTIGTRYKEKHELPESAMMRYLDLSDKLSWSDQNAIMYTNGVISTSSNFKITSYVNVSMFTKIGITIPIYTTSQGARAQFGLAFYDTNDQFVSSYRMPIGSNSAEFVELAVPEGAVYVRSTWYRNTSIYDGDFKFYGYYDGFDFNKITLGQDEICEFYRLSYTTPGTLEESGGLGVTRYIDCRGVPYVEMAAPITAGSGIACISFYDENKQHISSIQAHGGQGSNSKETRCLRVPPNATYMRMCYYNYASSATHGEFSCTYYSPEYKDSARPYQSGYTFFSQVVNNAVNQYWETDWDTELDEDYKETTGVLLLPETYTPNGKPTPVIMYFHGYSHYVYYDHWGDDEAFRTQKSQWAAQGFAVIDCNGARNNNKENHYTSGGGLPYSDGYHKCFDYVKRHYNVEQSCHVICVSAGGIPGINYCYWFNDAKSLLMLSAWTSLYSNSYIHGVYDTIDEYLGMDITGTGEYERDKTIGFNPATRIITIADTDYLPSLKVPAKAVVGGEEVDTDVSGIYVNLTRFVTALRNAGQSVSLRVVDGADHKDICSSANLALNIEYANWCKSV